MTRGIFSNDCPDCIYGDENNHTIYCSAHTISFESPPIAQEPHHDKNCAIWTVTLDGEKKPCDCGASAQELAEQPKPTAQEPGKCNAPECPLGSTIIGWPHPIEEGCIQFLEELTEGPTGCLDDDDELSKALAQISPSRLNQILREELESPPAQEPERGETMSFEKWWEGRKAHP